MWGAFDFPDLSKFGNQLGEALQKAKDEVDKTIDSTFKFDDPAGGAQVASSAPGDVPIARDPFPASISNLKPIAVQQVPRQTWPRLALRYAPRKYNPMDCSRSWRSVQPLLPSACSKPGFFNAPRSEC